MKFKTTKKAIMNGYNTVVSIGYCNAQYLLKYQHPIAYTAGRDGWGADIYDVDGIAIVTGYSPFGNIRPSYDVVRQYDEDAHKLCIGANFDWKLSKEKVDNLLNQFIKEITKESDET